MRVLWSLRCVGGAGSEVGSNSLGLKHFMEDFAQHGPYSALSLPLPCVLVTVHL